MKLVNEEWRPIKGYEGIYEVSSLGRVKSFHGLGKTLRGGSQKSGYLFVFLCKKKAKRIFRTHRLVYEAFKGPLADGEQVDHIDGDKTNNELTNLRAVTLQENRMGHYSRPPSSSVYRGVLWSKQKRKWQARVTKYGKQHHAGFFSKESEAAKAYNEKAKALGFFPEALNQV